MSSDSYFACFDQFALFQGEGGPIGINGAPGARGNPVSNCSSSVPSVSSKPHQNIQPSLNDFKSIISEKVFVLCYWPSDWLLCPPAGRPWWDRTSWSCWVCWTSCKKNHLESFWLICVHHQSIWTLVYWSNYPGCRWSAWCEGRGWWVWTERRRRCSWTSGTIWCSWTCGQYLVFDCSRVMCHLYNCDG